MSEERILLQGLANMLRPQSSVAASPQVADAVARVGNWVGGRFFLMPDRLAFQTNALNRHFQHDTAALVIEIARVRRIETGRMLRFFKTLDLTTDDGLVRLRTGSRNRIALEAELRRLCPSLPAH